MKLNNIVIFVGLMFHCYGAYAYIYTIMNSTPVTIQVQFISPSGNLKEPAKVVFSAILHPDEDTRYDSKKACLFDIGIREASKDVSYAPLLDIAAFPRCYDKDWSVITAIDNHNKPKMKKKTEGKGKNKKTKEYFQFDLVERYTKKKKK